MFINHQVTKKPSEFGINTFTSQYISFGNKPFRIYLVYIMLHCRSGASNQEQYYMNEQVISPGKDEITCYENNM